MKRIILDGSDEKLREAVAAASEVLAAGLPARANRTQAGGVILYPTDTVYGLGVDASNAEALERLVALKSGRVEEKGFLVAVADLDRASRYVEVTETAQRLADQFLPGPLTLILKTKHSFPPRLREERGATLAIRIPDHIFCLELARMFERPYVTTSANICGMNANYSIDEVLTQLGERAKQIDLIIDGGVLAKRLPSTIVSIIGEKLEIVREGAISRESIQKTLNLV